MGVPIKTERAGKPIHIRDFPEDLHSQLKARAAIERVALREFIIQSLREAIGAEGKKNIPRARAS